MSDLLFLESIKFLNGKFENINLHNLRFNQTRKEIWGINDFLDLEKLISIPENLGFGLYKCRVLYRKNIEFFEFVPYQLKKIEKLKVLEINQLDYQYKYANREIFAELLAQKGDCDEILIVRNGEITDTSYSNLIFWNGERWLTPKNPLLKGVKRQKFLEQNIIYEQNITLDNLFSFQKCRMINAMLDFEIGEEIKMENIVL